MVVYELLDYGGLEEIVATLAPALRQRGHPVSVVCLNFVPSGNQYRRALESGGVQLAQFPPWVWALAPDWAGREGVTAALLRALTPIAWVLALAVWAVKRRPWPQALASAQGWLRGQLWARLTGPDRREALARLLLRWWRWRWRPDVLHIHGYTSFLPFVLDWAYASRLPAVYEEHQTPDPQFNWWERFKRSINKAPVVLAVSDESARMLREFCGVTRPIVAMTPIVADPAGVGGQAAARAAEQRPLQVTTIARLEENKGLPYLLEAAAQVRHAHPDAEFRVYGEGSLREALLGHAARLGLPGERIFAGPFAHADLPRIMAQTDVFLLSSVIEGLPVALIEAMAYGQAILVTAVGGNANVIEHGVNGLLCPAKDPACLAERLSALLADAGLRARLGAAARKSYEQGRYHPQAVCERFLAAYRQAVEESAALYA